MFVRFAHYILPVNEVASHTNVIQLIITLRVSFLFQKRRVHYGEFVFVIVENISFFKNSKEKAYILFVKQLH